MSENRISLREEQVQHIEELARALELMGMQPALGKVLALLTVSDETELTFDQIMETLGLSKSAVSQALKQLEMTKRIGYKTRIGDRKRYFHLVFSDWKAQLGEFFDALGNIIEVNKRIIASRNPKTKDFNKHLVDRLDFMTMVFAKAMEGMENHK